MIISRSLSAAFCFNVLQAQLSLKNNLCHLIFREVLQNAAFFYIIKVLYGSFRRPADGG